jgi:hypothetical protein
MTSAKISFSDSTLSNDKHSIIYMRKPDVLIIP